jgi:hypothetical protein
MYCEQQASRQTWKSSKSKNSNLKEIQMSAVVRICASCSGLFTPDQDEHNTLPVRGKSMVNIFYICDECIAREEDEPQLFELVNKNAVASAPHTPTAWTMTTT